MYLLDGLVRLYCLDCKKLFLDYGNKQIAAIFCPYCKSGNYDNAPKNAYIRDLKQPNGKNKVRRDRGGR